jgi:hypothetical protein
VTTGIELFRRAEIGDSAITSMLVENPRRVLAFEQDPR